MRRLIVGPCRSGTTMLLRAFRNHPDTVLHKFQSIKSGMRKIGKPDYSFFQQGCPKGKFLVAKETIGYRDPAECSLEVFPSDRINQVIQETRPQFCFREPYATYQSWLNNSLVPKNAGPRLFIQAYEWTYVLYQIARSVSEKVAAVIYEQICENPSRLLQELCVRWEIPYDKAMMHWKDDFSKAPGLDGEGIQAGHYHRVVAQRTIEKQLAPELTIPRDDLEILNDSSVRSIYEKLITVQKHRMH